MPALSARNPIGHPLEDDARRPASTPPADEPAHRRGRPGALIALWMLVLAVAAAVAPLVQETLGIPWDVLSLIMLGPAIATLVVRLAVPRWRPTPWARVPWRAVLAPAALALIYVAVVGACLWAIGGRPPVVPAEVAGVPVAMFLILQIVGAFGEEVGWRGEVQRAGEQFMPAWAMGIVGGTLFGATHIGNWPLGLAFVAWFTLSSVVMVVAIEVVWRGSLWQKMVPAVIIHAGTNLALWAMPTDLASAPLWLLPVPGAIGLAIVAPLAWAAKRRRTSPPALLPDGSSVADPAENPM